MQTTQIEFPRVKALELYRAYKKDAHYSVPIDKEVRRAYQLISQGKLIIRALESVKTAGIYTEGPSVGFPKLALCRADATACEVSMWGEGGCHMVPTESISGREFQISSYGPATRSRMVWLPGSFEFILKQRSRRATALVPTPPLTLRPKRGLANYCVLWEADWTHAAPHDPMLLRRIGRGDLWLVVAAWDLTEVERAALATRITR